MFSFDQFTDRTSSNHGIFSRTIYIVG